MAFTTGSLTPVFFGGSGMGQRWQYITADSLATVMASGYFDSTVANKLKIGDAIDVVVVDAVAPASRTAVTTAATIYVATNDLTTVTTTTANFVPIATTATTLTITKALHNGRTVVINSAAPIAITLPQATGTGSRYRFVIGVVATATAHTIKVANGTDVMTGYSFCVTTSSDNAEGFKTSASSDTITLNGTTQGGVVGDIISIEDIATGIFSVLLHTAPTGTEATPFSASVS